MGTTKTWRKYAYYVCILFSLLQAGQPCLAIDTTGTVIYRGWDTKQNKQAADIRADTTQANLTEFPTDPTIQGPLITLISSASYQDDGTSTFIVFRPVSTFKIKLADNINTSNTIPSWDLFSFTPTEGMLFKTSSPAFENKYGQNAIAEGFADFLGYGQFNDYIRAGNPVSAGSGGFVLGEWLRIDNDAHIYDGTYCSGGAVIGHGAQHHGPDGALWLETSGTCTTPNCASSPATGIQETVFYTDKTGTRIRNHFPGAETGSQSTTFNFDDGIVSSGTLNASSAILSGGLVSDTVDTGNMSALDITASNISVSNQVDADTVNARSVLIENESNVPNVTEILGGTGISVDVSGSNVTIATSGESSFSNSGQNGKTVSNDSLGTVPSGKTFVPRYALIVITAANTATVPGVLSIGTNSPNYNNIVPATTLTGLTAAGNYINISIGASVSSVVSGSTQIFARVSVGYTATSITVKSILEGFTY